MTNEERIKNMSTEELAKFIESSTESCDSCPAMMNCPQGYRSCYIQIMGWLKEEAEE